MTCKLNSNSQKNRFHGSVNWYPLRLDDWLFPKLYSYILANNEAVEKPDGTDGQGGAGKYIQEGTRHILETEIPLCCIASEEFFAENGIV